MSRTVPEWIGKTDDDRVPDRVRLRIFDRHNGCCWISGRKIRAGEKWEVEHMTALSLGGRHAESNLAPALVEPHKIKTKSDRRTKAKNDRVRKRHLGLKKRSGRPMPFGRDSKFKKRMDGKVVPR